MVRVVILGTALLCILEWMVPGALQVASVSHTPPVSAIEQNNVGVGYMNQYRFADAAKAFQKALSIDPEFNLARINLGIAFLYDADLDEGEKRLREALAKDPGNPHGLFCLALILKNKGEFERAIERLVKLTEIDGKYAPAHYHLGVLYARLGKSAEAQASLRRTLQLEPDNISALYNLGTLLIKAGRAEEGNVTLRRFRELESKGGESLAAGTAYGEMGEYALAMDYKPHYEPSASIVRQTAPGKTFADRTEEAGLSKFALAHALPAGGWNFSASDWSLEFLRTQLLGKLGGGIALADLDGDGSIDAVVTRFNFASKTWESLVLLNDGRGHFRDATGESGLRNSGVQVSAAIGDYDNDGLPDIYLVGLDGNRLYRNLGRAKFQDVTGAAGVADGGLCVSATFVDYDHDGDLDLYVSHLADVSSAPSGRDLVFPESFPGAPNRMFRNNGNGTFTEYAETLGVGGGKMHHTGMVPSDIDNDRDIDFIVSNWMDGPQFFSNERNDHFTEVSGKVGIAGQKGYGSLTVADFNRDGRMDLFLSPFAGSNLLFVNRRDGTFEQQARPGDFLRSLPLRRYGSGWLDWDNDGNLDLYVLRDGSGELWENEGDGTFVYGGDLPCTDGRAGVSADFNGDGRVDILCLDRVGGIHFLANESGYANHWLGIQLQGLRSNRFAFGAKVEVRGGLEYQKIEIQGHNGYLSQDCPIVWIGLGQASQADSITVRWPSGILQSEINVQADRIIRIKELDRKGTSCPLLYSWNGRKFQFVTDFLGGCAIGYLEAPGRYSVPDTDEYVKIEGPMLEPRDGKYLLNLNNQLEEVIMFDQAQLVVADHPGGTGIYPNERLMPAPPYPEFKVFTTREARPPVSASDQNGNDILPLIAVKDRKYPTGFRSLPFKGYAETHSITFDLGPLPAASRILLLLDGWIDYADSSSNLAAAQAGLSQIAPYLQVKDARGDWNTVMNPMGFPAGLPKTMVVDLTGKFLCGDHHVRIVTNMKIYWDRIRVDTSNQEPVRLTRLDPASAVLHFAGYPRYYSPDTRLPWIYDYGAIGSSEMWGTHAGAYTRFGDVRALLVKRDDKFVITRNGDEISLAFDAEAAPPLPIGWTRDYLLYADGYGKDMDLNSLYADDVGPLPFHMMSRFPYGPGESYPSDVDHVRYQREYNTRVYPPPSRVAVR
jgi:tetratricopeptide (TPR) repeat protein